MRNALSTECFFPWLIAIFVVCAQLGVPFIRNIGGFLYIAAIIMLAVYNIRWMKSIYLLPVIFLLGCSLSIVLGNPPDVFQSWKRFIVLLLLLLAVSPICSSQASDMLKKRIFFALMWLLTYVAVGSFICYFLGVNYMGMSSIGSLNQAGYFGGLTYHSMTLGPICALAAIFNLKNFLNEKKLVYIVLCGISILTTLLSGSRASLMALVGASAYLLMFLDAGRDSTKIKWRVMVIGLLCFMPFIETFYHFIEVKNQANLDNGGFTSSRDALWHARWEEFMRYPLWGCGYASEEITNSISLRTGRIEPGTSWGAVFAQTGLMGGLPFCLLFFKGLIRQYVCRTGNSSFYVAILIFFALHMCAEGYVIAAGNPFSMYVWLTMAIALTAQKKQSEKLYS